MSPELNAPGPKTSGESDRPNEMPETSALHGRAFDDNIDILFDEIVLAAHWGRPSLLLAVQKSKFGKEKAEKILEERLDKEGFQIERIVINDQRSDIAQLMREARPLSKPVYFISNIDWGGGADGRQAYRALNLHRELFVEQAIRAVFWLTVSEAANLPRFAPDFWAFRHRVVEFVSQRAAGKVHLPAGILAWDVERSPDPFEDTRGGIEAREDLLRRLPESPEALSPRIELHASLGHLHWRRGDLVRAAQEFETGLTLSKDYELPELKASLLNGTGIILYEGGNYAGALQKFTEGLRYRSSSRALLINISAVDCILGRIQEALEAGKRAVRANPSEADTWRRLGYIYNAAGKTDEAITRFAKACELSPRAAEQRLSLAVMYSLIDRLDEARRQLTRVRELAGGEVSRYEEIVRRAALGDPAKAMTELKAALEAGALTKDEVRRDVNLGLLFDAEDLEEVLA